MASKLPPKNTGVKREKKAQRKKPAAQVQKLLYTLAGGRCQLCQTYLLESDDIGYYEFNRGEMAHIVGQSLDDASPRGNYPLAKNLRDEVDNLMLLCPTHHQVIDQAIAQGDFTVELLRRLKTERELHIKHVTGIPQDYRTCIVRLVGRIRENTVQITRSECNSATLFHSPSRFANFALDYHRQGVEMDITGLGEPEDNPVYYEMARRVIDQQLQLIRQGIEQNEIVHLSVFAFARIPILVYLGFKLGNKVGSTLFQRRRVDANHWHWLNEEIVQAFEWKLLRSSANKSKVAFILNVSGSIHEEELPDEVKDDHNIYVISPAGVDPGPDTVLTQQSLVEFRNCYRALLAHIETQHKPIERIHVFPAVPLSVAIACGSDLMPHAHPELVVYDRMPRNFKYALSINSIV